MPRSPIQPPAVGLAAWIAAAAMLLAAGAAHAAGVPCRPHAGTTTLAHSAGARIFADSADGNDYDGTGIAPGSLHLAGSRLRWLDGGQPRVATLR
jgi:hypothetical protein